MRGLVMRSWLWRARRRNPRAIDLWAHRPALIRRIASGRSFIDLGGMWNVHGRAAFLAEEAGAKRVVLYDGMDPTPEFQEEHEHRSSSVRYVQGDLHDPESVAEVGTFDIVWCTGVLYHSPNPYLLLEHLRRMTGERLTLGTHLIPEVPGVEQACIFYPGLSDEARAALAWGHGDFAARLLGAAKPFDRTPMLGYANFWWGITPSALESMLEIAGFDVADRFEPSPFFADVLAVPRELESTIPPPSFARERGHAREAGFEPGTAPGWARAST